MFSGQIGILNILYVYFIVDTAKTCTVELGYNDHGYNEQNFKKFSVPNGDFTT